MNAEKTKGLASHPLKKMERQGPGLIVRRHARRLAASPTTPTASSHATAAADHRAPHVSAAHTHAAASVVVVDHHGTRTHAAAAVSATPAAAESEAHNGFLRV